MSDAKLRALPSFIRLDEILDLGPCNMFPRRDWMEVSIRRAIALYANEGLHRSAALLAATHERGVEYLEQAPVLALAVPTDCQLRTAQERYWAALHWGRHMERGARLRDVMAAYKMPVQLRKIPGVALAPKYRRSVLGLVRIDQSTLAQIIPAGGRARTWLECLQAWNGHLAFRGRLTDDLSRWAAIALGRYLMQTRHREWRRRVTDVADFVSDAETVMDPRWTWDRATDLSIEWHTALQNRQDHAQFAKRHGKRPDETVDYGPLPLAFDHDGFSVVALRSAYDLAAEGSRMHHCVASYADMLYAGTSRFYSIAREGRPIATVQLANGRSVQAKGPCNRPLNGEAALIVHELEKRCRHAQLAAAQTKLAAV